MHIRQIRNPGAHNVGDRLSDRHPAARRRIDQRQRGTLTNRNRLATKRIEAGNGNSGICHWHLPRPDHLVSDDLPTNAAIADCDQESLVGYGWQTQYPFKSLIDMDLAEIQRRIACRTTLRLALHPRRVAKQGRHRQVHRVHLIAATANYVGFGCPVRKAQVGRRGGRADNTEKATFTRAKRLEFLDAVGRNGQHVALLRLVTPQLHW